MTPTPSTTPSPIAAEQTSAVNGTATMVLLLAATTGALGIAILLLVRRFRARTAADKLAVQTEEL
jgi:hypothetical protein